MSFFNLSDNSTLNTTGEFDANPAMEPIPKGTQVKAAAEEVKWDEYQGEEFIKITWAILDGEYKGRKIFHKIKVKNHENKTRDKALRMLAAIDTNANGGLVALNREPMDHELQSGLLHKPMCLLLQVWDIDGKSGNWVSAVSPIAMFKGNTPAVVSHSTSAADDLDDMLG